MKTKIITVLVLLLSVYQVIGQDKIWDETDAQKKERMAWWTADRFGMFIHWGLYALPARHEWVKRNEKMTNEEYQKYFDQFNPDLYNPSEWAKVAKEAGMRYAVITTKHHEGFTLFDSEFTDYNATNTPYGKDLLKEWVEAFRAEGIKIGFYYSLIDWHHPHFTIDRIHPLRPRSEKEYNKLNKGRDISIYRKYLHNQVREILTNYGKVDVLWMDFSYPGKHGKDKDDWGSVELLKMVRELQPEIIVNNRTDLQGVNGAGDFVTPEQFKVPKWPTIDGKKVPWETCQTFSGSWGYHRDENTWKSSKQLLVLLIETVSKGGNLLLNVGPTARGIIDKRAQNSLENIGDWMRFNSRSIYNCTQAPEEFEVPNQTLLTYNEKTNRLYVHLIDYPLQNFVMKGMKGKIKYAQFLHDASEIKISKPYGHAFDFELGKDDVNLALPVIKPDVEIPVIEIILK